MSAPWSIPNGMKNMLAILCSYPIATKPITGNHNPMNFPAVLDELIPNHTARHTSQLAPIPFKKTVIQDIDTLATAIFFIAECQCYPPDASDTASIGI